MAVDSEVASHATSAPEPRGDAYYWRWCAMAFSFLAFGIGAIVVGVVLLPLVRIVPATRERKRDRARVVMRVSQRLFVAQMRGIGGLTYEFRGTERLGRPGQIIVANHPSLIDVVFLLAFTPGANCVVKHGLWRNPLTRAAVTLAEYIANQPTASMIEAASQALQSGQCLIMFPEGTRTTPHQPFVFHRGAANIALRAASVITPVTIRCTPTTLTKAEPWYRITSRRVRFTLEVGEDIDMQPYRSMDSLPIASRAFNEHLQRHFQEALAG